MKASDRAVVIIVAILGLLAAFWFLLLSPKREEVSELDRQVSDAQSALTAAQQEASLGEEAKADYASNYHQLVVLGKAVPAEEETSSLLVQLQALASKTGISFDSITLADSGAAEPVAPAQETTADAGTGQPPGETSTDSTLSAAPATEAAAATLPLGATVGPAGLPVMPYDLNFRGDFFGVANFIRDLDGLVESQRTSTGVDGRLLTIDGFSLGPDQEKGFPHLVASLHVTTYVAPAGEGLTAGATPSAPAEPVPPGTATPTSSTTVTP
jgi:type II secretory pathway pseudopilin PulG